MPSFMRVAPDIELLKVPLGPIWTGVYLVLGERNYLIDSASSDSDARDIILPALKERGFSSEDITWLLCTHCHGDHVGGHYVLCENGFYPVCFSSSAAKLRDPLLYSKKIRAAFPDHSPEAPAGLKGCEPVRLVKDNELIGGYLRLIHTPGHDTDTVCFLDERTGSLISGDSLQWNGTVTQGTALVMDLKGYRQSIKKLLTLDIRRILCAHPYLPVGEKVEGADDSKAALSECTAIMDEYEAFILGEWDGGCRDAALLAEKLVDHVGGKRPEHLFLPLHTVREILTKAGHPTLFS